MTMHPDDDFVELQSSLGEVSCGALSVVVDFNELLSDKGEEEAFRLIGTLKDLLP